PVAPADRKPGGCEPGESGLLRPGGFRIRYAGKGKDRGGHRPVYVRQVLDLNLVNCVRLLSLFYLNQRRVPCNVYHGGYGSNAKTDVRDQTLTDGQLDVRNEDVFKPGRLDLNLVGARLKAPHLIGPVTHRPCGPGNPLVDARDSDGRPRNNRSTRIADGALQRSG